MKYNTPEEKEQIKKAFQVLMVMNNYTINSFAVYLKIDPQRIYQALNQKQVDHEKIQGFINKIDKKLLLQNVNGKMVICKKI